MNLRLHAALMRLALKHPGLGWQKAWMMLSRCLPSRKHPRLVSLTLHGGCNLRCRMCSQWGDHGTSPGLFKPSERPVKAAGSSSNEQSVTEPQPAVGKRYLDINVLQRILDQLKLFRPELYIWGGEPTLHPDFGEFITAAKAANLVVTVNTNGVLLDKHAEAILDGGVDSLDVSLNGTAAVHDAIVQVPGTFQRVMKGLECFSGVKRRPLIKAEVTISEHNLEDVESLLEFIDSTDTIDMTLLQLGWFTNEAVGHAYGTRMRSDFDTPVWSWRGYADEAAPRRAEAVRDMISRIRGSSRYRKPIIIHPDLRNEDVGRYFTHHSETFGRHRCPAVYFQLEIRANGDAVVCADYPDYVLGNVLTQPIGQIWNGSRLKRLRRSLKTKGLLPICSQCCGLYR